MKILLDISSWILKESDLRQKLVFSICCSPHNICNWLCGWPREEYLLFGIITIDYFLRSISVFVIWSIEEMERNHSKLLRTSMYFWPKRVLGPSWHSSYSVIWPCIRKCGLRSRASFWARLCFKPNATTQESQKVILAIHFQLIFEKKDKMYIVITLSIFYNYKEYMLLTVDLSDLIS